MALLSPERNSKLKAEIRETFIHYVIPDNLLSVIKKYGPDVLTDRDIDCIRMATQTKGKIIGAEELLDYMSRYKGWFPCLLRALEDPSVKLKSLAQQFAKAEAQLDAIYIPASQVFRDDQAPQNDFDFDIDGAAASGEGAPSLNESSIKFDTDGPMDQACGYDKLQVQNNDQPRSPNRPLSYEYEIPVGSSPGGAGAASGAQVPHSRQGVQGAQEEEPAHVRHQRHGRNYDFGREETESEFSAFPGWNPNISESMVRDKMESFLMQDGRYILWYWSEMKRPAISVTYEKTLKNFIVHKKPHKSRPGEVKYYFINKEQHYEQSVVPLVQFHLQRGIRNTERGYEDQIIPLRQHVNP